MSTVSQHSAWTETSSRAPGGESRFREHRLRKTAAVKALIYFTGRDPRKVKGVRVYRTTWSEDASDTSSNSFWSNYSWGSGRQPMDEICFLEARGMYYYDDAWDDDSRSPSVNRHKHKKKRGPPRKGGGKRRPESSSEDDSDSESSSSDASLGDYGDVPQGMGGYPPPRMMPGMNRGPPPGPFMYGRPQQAAYAPRPMTGSAPPPPPPAPGATPVPPQPGFTRTAGGLHLFGVNP